MSKLRYETFSEQYATNFVNYVQSHAYGITCHTAREVFLFRVVLSISRDGELRGAIKLMKNGCLAFSGDAKFLFDRFASEIAGNPLLHKNKRKDTKNRRPKPALRRRLLRAAYIKCSGRCWYCNQPITLNAATLEHLVAVSRKGANSEENTVVACKRHNHYAGRKTLVAKKRLKIMLTTGRPLTAKTRGRR